MQGSTAVSALHQGTFAISGSAPNGLLSPFNFPSLLPTQSTSTLPSIVSYGLAPLRPPTTRDNRMMDNTPQAQTHFRGPIFPPQPLGDVRKQTYTSRASLGRYVPYSSSSRTHARAVATQFAGASLPDYGVGYSVHGTAAFTLDNAPSSLGAPVASSSLMPARAISPSMTLDAGSIGQAAQVAHRPHTSSSSRGPGQRAPTFMELLHGDLDLFPDPSEYANPSAPQSAADSRPLQDPDAVSTSYLPYQDNHDSFSDSPSFLTAQLVHSLGGDASAGFESVHTSVSAAPLEQQPFDDDDILSSCIKHDFTTSFVVPPQ
ncbi:hypothetical protein C8Q78DRAFT_997093 [Trametes maxima]|nr:hypothetical protein C8Q78DRAFT_997093 [Trametes maxima]